MNWMMSSGEITREIIDKLGDKITPTDDVVDIINQVIYQYISERDDIIDNLKDDILDYEAQQPNFD